MTGCARRSLARRSSVAFTEEEGKHQMLERNRSRVQNLTGSELWFFIVGRVLIAASLGILAMIYFPDIARHLWLPLLLLGSMAFFYALRGLFRNQ
jgi:hypothetical protein